MDATPRVLKNKGILVAVGDEKVEVRFTHDSLSDIEEAFGSIEDWQTELQKRPASASRRTLAITLGRGDEPDSLKGELPSPLSEYITAITVAWSVANGLDPTVATEVYEKAMQMGSAAAAGELLEAIQEATKEV